MLQIKQEETLFSIYRRKNMRSSLMVEKDARIEVEREERDDLEETQNEPDDFNSIPPWKSQITFRGIVASLIIGIIYNLIVMKLNLTTGLIPTLNVSAALSAFVLLRSWTKLLTKAGIMTKPFTKQENTVVQTCAVACYSVTIGGGFGSYLLSLNTRTYEQSGVHTEGNSPGSTKEPGIGWMTCFLFFTCFVGLLALVPLRKVLQTRNCFNLHKTQLKWYFIVVAYMIAPSLGFSNAYGAGLTDMNMAYNYGKVALFILAAMSGKQNGVVAGLVGCGLIKSIVSISSDLMHDFKTGHLTLTSPRSMLVSQAIGTGIGCIVAPLSFFLFYKAFDVGNPEGEYKAPYALVYRNMAILGVEGFSALPLHCLQLCYGFFAFAVAADVVRDLSPEKVGKWVPLPMAMAVPFLVGGYFAVDMCVGSLIVFVWNMRDRVKAGLMVPAVASGLICGDGLWILPSSILALAGVKPPICMRFVPSK
ncbi:metal-nicotianamine transporter YSL3-like [Brassica napus]|uniref:metal-nicotianamine transporter YSL3-like n=1 Tax=Brassica napus TaxID=3708 RepID=UPI002078869D|nr:metal-nicotianamine transporter YSL3-like [Brassica napus]